MSNDAADNINVNSVNDSSDDDNINDNNNDNSDDSSNNDDNNDNDDDGSNGALLSKSLTYFHRVFVENCFQETKTFVQVLLNVLFFKK